MSLGCRLLMSLGCLMSLGWVTPHFPRSYLWTKCPCTTDKRGLLRLDTITVVLDVFLPRIICLIGHHVKWYDSGWSLNYPCPIGKLLYICFWNERCCCKKFLKFCGPKMMILWNDIVLTLWIRKYGNGRINNEKKSRGEGIIRKQAWIVLDFRLRREWEERAVQPFVWRKQIIWSSWETTTTKRYEGRLCDEGTEAEVHVSYSSKSMVGSESAHVRCI